MKKLSKLLKFFPRKNVIIWMVIIAIALLEMLYFLTYGGGLALLSSYYAPKGPAIEGIILFEEKDCDHCQRVETFIKNNKVEEKVPFTRLDINATQVNMNILADKAQTCGLDTSQVGVPFLWDGQKCILGDTPVIDFFRTQMSKKP